MKKERIRQRLEKILEKAPALKEILFSPGLIDSKRQKIRRLLSNLLYATFEENPAIPIPPLEWIMTRDAVKVLRNILSVRSEKLAGYSLLQYIDDLIHKEDLHGVQEPSPGFFAELEHLVKGVMGKTEIYSEKVPAFLKYEGVKAARLRSSDLSRMAGTAQNYMDRYACGLDENAVRRRETNKKRILKHFGASEQDWGEWKWHTGHIIRNIKTLSALIKLTDEEYKAVELARKHKIPFGITPYYLSLMDYAHSKGRDAGVRAQVIPSLHYIESLRAQRRSAEGSMDFMLERDTSPIDGITRRYPMVVILKPVLTCPQICVYCQRNWEIEDVYSPRAVVSREKLEKAIQWIADRPEIKEVLVTGGDPFILSDSKIETILRKLSRIRHVERIRIGTRTPVTLPQRISDSLVDCISRFHRPGKREIIIITHFEHSYEITPQSVAAVSKFQKSGVAVYNQLVYTFYTSRKFEAAALRHKLRLSGVTPYYTFNTKGKEETDDYRVPIARLLQERKEEARLMPGTVRTDDIVFNVPGLGKNDLRASQHHDIISILPDGRRVYEFHPWEKKLSLMDTYIYTDVSIYDYLQRLKKSGEKSSDYKTIWYYY
ncbi:MAG: KamA family radical SAM protein [Thermodesulfobacteriota bacterium]|nr:KamA family radical SAM protein [Thermodesulfobacteriota bacterium]